MCVCVRRMLSGPSLGGAGPALAKAVGFRRSGHPVILGPGLDGGRSGASHGLPYEAAKRMLNWEVDLGGGLPGVCAAPHKLSTTRCELRGTQVPGRLVPEHYCGCGVCTEYCSSAEVIAVHTVS